MVTAPALAVVVLLMACTSGNAPSSTPRSTPTAVAASTPTLASAGPSQVVSVPTGRIVFDRLVGQAGPEGQYLGTFIADSSGVHKLQLPVTADDIGLLPAWSPDARRLVINILPGYPEAIHPAIVNADGTGFHYVNRAALTNFECSAWSPDGESVLCSTNSLSHKRNGIYRITMNGTGLTQLTTSPYDPTPDCGGGDSRAQFSPDGRSIAFIRQECSQPETAALIVARADGSGQREIVKQGGVRTHAGSRLSWSPDGRWIVFGTQDLELALVHPDGTALHTVPLPSLNGLAMGPVWSPDGKRIAFSAADDLYVVAPDGTGLVTVAGTGPGEYNVDWGRAPA